jgi:2-haloacid dehalogenase
VFDLGAVLIDWDARYLYRAMLPDDAAIATFLDAVGFAAWNDALDAGRDWDEAVEELAAQHPDRRALIEAFRDRWEETLGAAIEPVVAILVELADAGIRTFALSNWSRRTFDIARHRFAFLDTFEGVVISGDVGITKPDPAIYRLLLERHALVPAGTVFIDDREANVAAAERAGMVGVTFSDAVRLRRDLVALGLPLAPQPATG